MNEDRVVWGDVLVVSLPGHIPPGREQEGLRPAVVVGIPPNPLRFPVLILAPLTTQRGTWSDANRLTYPELAAGVGGLSRPSTVLLDQIRACDAARIRGRLGHLDEEALTRIQRGLWTLFRAPTPGAPTTE